MRRRKHLEYLSELSLGSCSMRNVAPTHHLRGSIAPIAHAARLASLRVLQRRLVPIDAISIADAWQFSLHK